MTCRGSLALILLTFGSTIVLAGDSPRARDVPYLGYEGREAFSLSPEDLAELRRGGGWGLALAAELSGLPDPARLLALKDEIPLNGDQIAAVAGIQSERLKAAMPAAERFIAAEMALDQALAEGDIETDVLNRRIEEIEKARAALRLIHIKAHLATPEVLTTHQLSRYEVLSGYRKE